MDIKILKLFSGAEKARGLTVIIDVFRAFSVCCYAFHNNARRIITTGSLKHAYDLKLKYPDSILMGEREGKKQPGFDYGNSPADIEYADFNGKTLIHTTSAGTKGISLAKNACEILTGSLVNAQAIASYIKDGNYRDVSLVAMGNGGLSPADEDNLCAEYIESLLKGSDIILGDRIEALKNTTGKRFFDREKPWFPEKDFSLCTRVNSFDFVVRADVFDEQSHVLEAVNLRARP